jgi:hypothetical protein
VFFSYAITGPAAKRSITDMASGINGKFQCPDQGKDTGYSDYVTWENKFVNPSMICYVAV